MATPIVKKRKIMGPHPTNDFPPGFEVRFAEQIACMYATRQPLRFTGDDWEDVFAKCIGGESPHAKVGLDDVVWRNFSWSCKTVASKSKKFAQLKNVRLISGRNSISYSFGNSKVLKGRASNVGKQVLEIWNRRLSDTAKAYGGMTPRCVVLVRNSDCTEFLLFEKELQYYDPTKYHFTRNKSGNIEGYEKQGKKLIHKFTWQHSGSQFTIIEDIPLTRLHIKVKRPPRIDQASILQAIGFDKGWVELV